MIKGNVWKFGNNVDTDQIIASQYLLLPTVEEMQQHVFESVRSDFSQSFKVGDIVVAGSNFGCGSSREQAPLVLKNLGVSVVVAKSFARIFFRNSINIGLPLVLCEGISDDIADEDVMEISFETGEIFCKGQVYLFSKFPG